MTETLLDSVRRHADSYAGPDGIAPTPIPGLTLIRALMPSGLSYAIARPLVCLVLQGAKHVAMGKQSFSFAAGDSLLIAADVPTVSQITRASIAAPYFSLVLDLNPAVIADLLAEMKANASRALPARASSDRTPVRVETTEPEVADAALRLMRLLDRPASIPILALLAVSWQARGGDPTSWLARR